MCGVGDSFEEIKSSYYRGGRRRSISDPEVGQSFTVSNISTPEFEFHESNSSPTPSQISLSTLGKSSTPQQRSPTSEKGNTSGPSIERRDGLPSSGSNRSYSMLN